MAREVNCEFQPNRHTEFNLPVRSRKRLFAIMCIWILLANGLGALAQVVGDGAPVHESQGDTPESVGWIVDRLLGDDWTGKVSVTENKAGELKRSTKISREGIWLINCRVPEVIKRAYGFDLDAQILNVPFWALISRYDIQIKWGLMPPDVGSASANHEELIVREVLRRILARNFQMKARLQTRERGVYALVVDKDQIDVNKGVPAIAALVVADNSADHMPLAHLGPGEIEVKNSPISELARILSTQQGLDDLMVIDRTGLTGNYDWELKWKPGSSASIQKALEDELGLTLRLERDPVPMIFIDNLQNI